MIEQGLKGLTALPGIGPKKAEAVLKFAEEVKVRVEESFNEELIPIETDKESKTSENPVDEEEDDQGSTCR